MGFPLLAFILVSHLLVIHSSDSCPSSFNCSGPLDPIKSPSTDDTLSVYGLTTHSIYGLCTVSCDEPDPKVIWGGIPYQVSNTTHGTIKINDPALKTNHCDFSSYIPPLHNTLSVSFTISPNLTIFKCNTSSPELKREAEDYFHENHNRYEGCEGGYTVYYPRPNDQVKYPTQGNPPPNCQFFQLPLVKDGGNTSDLFSLLTSNFSVEYYRSDVCLTCLDDDGGQCLRPPREFQCSKKAPTHPPYPEHDVAGRKRLGLILGTGTITLNIIFKRLNLRL